MKGRVLIIEDEKELAELIELYLLREGIECDSTAEGERGLKMVVENSYDLILLDLNLPGMDGFQFLGQLRISHTIPVIIVSAREADEDIIMGLGIGADEFVSKPFVPRVLAARVRAMIRRKELYSAPSRELLCFGPYCLDYDGYLLKRGDLVVGLSTREFEVLRFLVKNRGRVCPPDEIYKSVWHQEFGDLAAIAVYIQRIRKKIEEDYHDPLYIRTVHGKGYLFEQELKI